MRILNLLLVLIITAAPSFAQRLSGRILNDDDGMALEGAVVENITHPATSASDHKGNYSISAYKGDSLKFYLMGYAYRVLVFTGSNEAWFETVTLAPQSMVLDAVVIHRELTPYQKDSLERREIYGRAADYKPAKTRYNPAKNPFVVESPISGLMEKHTKRYKDIKRFQEMYAGDEKASFIASKYDPELVTSLTGLKETALYDFMQAYPMAYDYARAASDLEIKMWIKYNYREWTGHSSGAAADTTHKP